MDYDDILVPTDGSEAVDAALDHAFALAELLDARVHALYVADTNRDSVVLVGTEVVDAFEKAGENAVEAVMERGRRHGIEVVDEILQGDPVSTIVDYADARGVDLIVMSSHGRRGLPRYLLGSVTERVTRSTDVPVLIVSPDGSANDGSGP